jgi:hypothetical protein
MPRVPNLPADVREPADLVAAIRARRGGSLLNLDRAIDPRRRVDRRGA